VNDVVGAFREKGAGDFITDVAGPIPFRIIATMVGIPTADAHMLWEWTNTLMPSKDPDYRADPDAPARAGREIRSYFGELLADHRKHPRNVLAGRSGATSVSCSRITASTRATTWPAWSSPWKRTASR
jgi:cytochrome P450